MKIPVVKKLTETYTVEELREAEAAIENGEEPTIDIEGEDEGERLTHAIAALTILKNMQEKNIEFREALREYTHRVRSSIG